MWLLDKLLRRLVRNGELTVVDHDGRRYNYGAPDPGRQPLHVRLTDRRAALDIARDPRLGAGEAYMQDRLVIESGDVAGLVDLIRSNNPWERGAGKLGLRAKAGGLTTRLSRLNWERRSRRNVAHHYDLSDRLYDLFLDSDRQYSCAYFNDPANSLEQAPRPIRRRISRPSFT